MKSVKFFTYVLLVGFLAACNPKQEGTDAEVSDAKEVAEASVEAVTYKVTNENSSVNWIGSKITGQHNGSIPIKEGSIAVRDGKIEGGKISLNIAEIQNSDLAEDAESQTKLLNHLKSDDFFDAENHPEATFEIVSVEPYDNTQEVVEKDEYDSEYAPATNKEFMVASPTHKITGNLTMRGKTLAVTFPAVVSIEANTVEAHAKFNIDRTNWGLSYGDESTAVDKAEDKFIYNTVNVALDVVAEANSTTAAM